MGERDLYVEITRGTSIFDSSPSLSRDCSQISVCTLQAHKIMGLGENLCCVYSWSYGHVRNRDDYSKWNHTQK